MGDPRLSLQMAIAGRTEKLEIERKHGISCVVLLTPIQWVGPTHNQAIVLNMSVQHDTHSKPYLRRNVKCFFKKTLWSNSRGRLCIPQLKQGCFTTETFDKNSGNSVFLAGPVGAVFLLGCFPHRILLGNYRIKYLISIKPPLPVLKHLMVHV